MTLDELKRVLEDSEFEDFGAAPVVLQQETEPPSVGVPVARSALVVTPCYWNPQTHEILSIEDEDVEAPFVRAVAIMVRW